MSETTQAISGILKIEMGHGHHHHGGSGRHSAKDRATHGLRLALLITLGFMALEAWGGILSNSLALLTDAFHMATDAASLLLSLFAIWLSRRQANARMTYGYGRIEIIGALFSGLLIWGAAGTLVFQAFGRMLDPPEVQGKVVLVIALAGMFANLAAMWILKKESSSQINVKAAYLHLFSDLLGSFGAILSGVILIWTDFRPIDPIVTVVFSMLMVASSWSLVRDAFEVLLESTPRGLKTERVRDALKVLTGVKDVHDLHIWSLSAGQHALSVHIVTEAPEGLLSRARELLHDQFGIEHATIQVEGTGASLDADCFDCGTEKPVSHG